MSVAGGISKAYLRWRHSRGYGVHSPFAYGLVKNAISPGPAYSYYGYHDIDAVLERCHAGRYPRLRNDARLLLRIMTALGSRRLIVAAEPRDVFAAAGKGAGAATLTAHGGRLPALAPGDFVVARGDSLTSDAVTSAIRQGVAVMAIEPSDSVRQFPGDSGQGSPFDGLLLTGKHITIAIPNPDMRFVSYTMKM